MFLLLNLNSCLAQDVKQKIDTLKQKLNAKNRPQLNGSFEKLNLDDFKNGLVITKERIKVDTNKHGIRRETSLVPKPPKKFGRKKV